jgi:serine/threonine protein kinase
MATAQPQADVGGYYGKYFLLKKMAAGGMGEIFLARQQGPAGFEKILVVKKVLAHLTENKEFVELFLGEARLAARMNHRNIVQVFELGEHQGSYFIAMEYVAGRTLRELIDAAARAKEKLPGEICRSIAEQICDGASYAHNLSDVTGRAINIIHRDLNPQNVIISYSGDVKIIDFGIAKSDMNTVKTEAGMIKGKFVYMSPEQSLAKKLDKRSDIFAIGISLYEMLTGINPFQKANIVSTLEAVQRYEPPPPSRVDRAYAPFDPIVAKALAKDRDRRYGDAAEMMDDLRRIVLPRPAERLAQLMARLFRQQLDADQQLLVDPDAHSARTPSRPSPTPIAKVQQADGRTMILNPGAPAPPAKAQPPEGGTVILSPAAVPKKPAPARPAPARRSATPARHTGAGDTLLDAGGPPAAPPDDVPGGTVMLKPGSTPPAPSARKGPGPTDTMPDAGEAAAGGDGRTVFLGTAPTRPQRKQGAAEESGATRMLSPDESQAATRDAMAKLKQAQQRVVRTSSRAASGAQGKWRGRGPWIALGMGAVAAVVGIAGLLFWLLSDEPAAPRPRRTTAAVAETQKSEPAPAPVVETKPRSQPAPPPPSEPLRPEPQLVARRVAGAGKLYGTLSVNPLGGAPVGFGGSPQPKLVGAYNLPVTADSGTVEVGDGSTTFKVQLEYVRTGTALSFKVNSSPGGIVWVDGASRGRVPVTGLKLESRQTLLELRKPGEDTGMLVKLQYRPN